MVLTIAVFAGVTAALFLHWFSWYIRLNHLSLAVYLGIIGAIGLTLFGALFLGPYTGEIAGTVLNWLIILWLFALLVGYLQARSLPTSWWKGVLSVFHEAALAFLIAAVVNLTLQQFVGQFENRFQISVYAFIDLLIVTFMISLATLAVIRPLFRLYKSRD